MKRANLSLLPATAATLLVASLATAPALADDRPVTAEERANLERVLAAENCSGGEFEFDIDDNKFEIEKALCSDGQLWEFDLDSNYNIIKKKLDD